MSEIAARFDDVMGGLIDQASGLARTSARIILLRHGHQDTGSAVALEDFLDSPLTELGRAQARAVALSLRSRLGSSAQDVRLLTSDMRRAYETATLVSTVLDDCDVVVDGGWREVELFTGSTGLPMAGAGEEEQWRHAGARFVSTGRWDEWSTAESSRSLRSRLLAAAVRLASTSEERPIVVCTHGGSINALVAELIGHSRDYWIPIAHASITSIRVLEDKSMMLQSLNETGHLEPSMLTY
ncbi:MAG: histidine phosphatase family protein [bacterium]|nr:histidine phosphatase family protein [bacterium]